MPERNPLDQIQTELKEGMASTKCRRCGCMKETLAQLQTASSSLPIEAGSDWQKNLQSWRKQMEPIKYPCLGCEYCFPAVAMNITNQSFPQVAEAQTLDCGFEVREQTWPPVPGEYFVLCEEPSCPVAVSTLAGVELAETLADIRPEGLCIVGKTETENIGVDKVIKNTIANPTIRFMLLTGKEPKGHQTGRTLLALWENGVDEQMKVIRSPGKRPILRNVTREEVTAFRKQVQVVDLIGCEDVELIAEKIKELAQKTQSTPINRDFRDAPDCGCEACTDETESAQVSTTPIIQAKAPAKVEMDKAGYFVILPQPDKGMITVEHYAYDNTLLRVIEGVDARSIYWTIISNGWVSQLSHAAYLGKELTKAELSIEVGFKYVQDGA